MSAGTKIDAALNPPAAASRLGERPLTSNEYMQRTAAACAVRPSTFPNCGGTIQIGLFFDGTGNNEDEDFKKPLALGPRHQCHSNVVRLYHAHRDEKFANDGYYRYYIPGLGTPFKEIHDDGGTAGSAFARYGAARIAWGLTRVFNAVYQHVRGGFLIDDKEAEALAYEASMFVRLPDEPDDLRVPAVAVAKTVLDTIQKHMTRQSAPAPFRHKLQSRLKLNLGSFAHLHYIVVNVFGFSRGAAEARVFVNWLFDICEHKDGVWLFAGVPLQVQFLGLFDTVASVGPAGLFSILEGRLGWARDNLQVHPAVKRCVHMVAAHEVRACFPLDSVRVDGRYPPNAVEYVYPGSHSDVGGGYMPLSLGKADWLDEARAPDRQLARIPGFEMYCQALAAGVPFRQFVPVGSNNALDSKIAAALKPSPATAKAYDLYCEQAAIAPGPVETMVSQHMGLYFTHRWRIGLKLEHQPEMRRAMSRPNQGKAFENEPLWMRDTQTALIHVIAGLCSEIDRRLRQGGNKDEALRHPFAFGDWSDEIKALLTLRLLGPASVDLVARRLWVLRSQDSAALARVQALAQRAPQYLGRWRDYLAHGLQADVRDTAVERDGLRLLEALRTEPLTSGMTTLFDALVHDSMAGFIGEPMPEFQANGHGIAKFRRIFFGNRGDAILREAAEQRNEANIQAARKRRANRTRLEGQDPDSKGPGS